ncbi:MAG: GFA family protein [Rhizobiaceae bacterium]|nr:GFA family protein [Rhizobiaceae bacterium]
MSLDNQPTYSGGCQCGAVRFHIEGALGDPSICHCRMCQKASGNFYMPLVSVGNARLNWTRAEPARYQSSNLVQRGFCPKCGTPLTYEAPDGVALAIGAFDHPEEIAPVVQWGMEGKLPYIEDVLKRPGYRSDQDRDAEHFINRIVSFQHPDFDTESWPAEQKK